MQAGLHGARTYLHYTSYVLDRQFLNIKQVNRDPIGFGQTREKPAEPCRLITSTYPLGRVCVLVCFARSRFFGRRDRLVIPSLAGANANEVDRYVLGNPEPVGTERRASAKAVERVVDSQERFLFGVLRVLGIAVTEREE